MSEAPATPPPRPPFQFTLRTLLLLFVVLGSSLAVFGASGIIVFSLILALAILLRTSESCASSAVVPLIALCLLCVIGLPLIQSAREAGRRANCTNRVKQIALALSCYEATYGCFPPAYTEDKSGKPLHSWRTLILPYFDETTLYRTINLTQPWDAATNSSAAACSPQEFLCPSDDSSRAPGACHSNYFAVVGPNTAWPGDKPRKLADLGPHASHTALVVEVADSSVAWMEPKDISIDALGSAALKTAGSLIPSSHHHPPESFFFVYDRSACVLAAMADGSVHVIKTSGPSPDDLRRKFEIGGFTDDDFADTDFVDYGSRRLNWPNIAALAVWLLSSGMLLVGAVRNRRPLEQAGSRNVAPGR